MCLYIYLHVKIHPVNFVCHLSLIINYLFHKGSEEEFSYIVLFLPEEQNSKEDLVL